MRVLGPGLLCIPAALCLAHAASAQPRHDPAGIVTFQIENDAVSTQSGTTDRYYTNGLRLGYTTGTTGIPEGLRRFSNAVWGDGLQRVSIDLSQSVFTPRYTRLDPPDPRDRPYAGWLHVDLSLIHDRDDSRSVLGLSLGVIGPSAGGRIVQNGWHDIIGDPPTRGWGSQLQDEPAIQLTAERTYRLPLARFGALETDALPSLTAGVGTVRAYVQAGFNLRLGQGLQSDFGAPRIRPGLTGSDPYTPVRPFAWYVFAGAGGQAVARDVFLDGSTFRARTPSVDKKNFLGELQGGLAVMFAGVRVTYTHVWRTEEFRGQKAGLFNFGSLALSARF